MSYRDDDDLEDIYARIDSEIENDELYSELSDEEKENLRNDMIKQALEDRD